MRRVWWVSLLAAAFGGTFTAAWHALPVPPEQSWPLERPVRLAKLAPDGRTLVLEDADAPGRWSRYLTAPGKLVDSLTGRTVAMVEPSDSGTVRHFFAGRGFLVTADDDAGTLAARRLPTGEPVVTVAVGTRPGGRITAAPAKDTDGLLYYAEDRSEWQYWDLGRNARRPLPFLPPRPGGGTLSPDGRWFVEQDQASLLFSGPIPLPERLWDLAAGRRPVWERSVVTHSPPEFVAPSAAHGPAVRAMAPPDRGGRLTIAPTSLRPARPCRPRRCLSSPSTPRRTRKGKPW